MESFSLQSREKLLEWLRNPHRHLGAEKDKIAKKKQDKEDLADEKLQNEKGKEGLKTFSYLLLVVIGMIFIVAAFGQNLNETHPTHHITYLRCYGYQC